MDTLPSYTPEQRRRKTQYSELSPANTQVAWTTARCNRLLRPIASRILLLRKSNPTKPATEGLTEHPPEPLRQEQNPAKSDQRTPIQAHPDWRATKGDPDWVPSPAIRRRVKHKYSSRTGESRVKKTSSRETVLPSTLPGEVVITTPVIDYKTRQYASTSQPTTSTSSQSGYQDTDLYDVDGRKRRKLQHYSSRSCTGDPMPHELRQNLKKTVTPSHWMLIDGLYTGLDALLKATRKSSRPSGSGVRSLFSTCLRRVPDYITAEQAWNISQDADDMTDVSSEVYTHLEDMGSVGKEGWRHLREVVRAHGIAMLGDALREGLIDHAIGRGLIIICINASAYDEAEILLSWLISRLGTIPRPSNFDNKLLTTDTSACLGTLERFASRCDRRGFQYRQLDTLLRKGVLPVEWMATAELAPSWARILQSISHVDKDLADAAQLLRTTMSLACGSQNCWSSSSIHNLRLAGKEAGPAYQDGFTLPKADTHPSNVSVNVALDDALTNTVSSVMTILVAIAISQRGESRGPPESGAQDPSKYTYALLGCLTVEILARFEFPRCRDYYSMSRVYQRRIITVVLAHLLLSKELQDHQEGYPLSRATKVLDMVTTLTVLSEPATPVASSEMAKFIFSIARCCSRASPGQEFKFIQKHVQYLASVANDRALSGAAQDLFASITSTTAFEYAEHKGTVTHLQWALGVEGDVSRRGQGSAHTPAMSVRRGEVGHSQGYRWEEGICEWIAKTPRIVVGKQKSLVNPPEPLVWGDRVLSLESRGTSPVVRIPVRCSGSPPLDQDNSVDAVLGNGDTPVITAPTRPGNCHKPKKRQADEAGIVGQEQSEARKKARGWTRCKGTGAKGRRGPWNLHVDQFEDELATVSLSLGHAKCRDPSMVEINDLGLNCKRRRESSGQTGRRSTCNGVRHQQGLGRRRVASLASEEVSEDELGM